MDWTLYPNFSEAEFRCKHTGQCHMQPAFMARLQALRTEYGRPMKALFLLWPYLWWRLLWA